MSRAGKPRRGPYVFPLHTVSVAMPLDGFSEMRQRCRERDISVSQYVLEALKATGLPMREAQNKELNDEIPNHQN